MADSQKTGLPEKDIDKAITALKKGAYLLKYGRRGKPKFCPFRLSSDESMLVWYSGKEEKQIKFADVSKIIPGQRTAIFRRYPRPEKEYQSFSLIYNDRSLDLICKDKDEAEIWFFGLKALISQHFWRRSNKSQSGNISSDTPHARSLKVSPSIPSSSAGDDQNKPTPTDAFSKNGFGNAFSGIVSYTASFKSHSVAEQSPCSLNPLLDEDAENSNDRSSVGETFRVSLSSAVSSSSHGSCRDDFDSLGDIFIWGEGVNDGLLGGGTGQNSSCSKADACLPKPLESTAVLDVLSIACGSRHAVLVSRQGEIFSWGEESGGRLGHGIDTDVSQPKLISTLSGLNVDLVACGEHHSCAVTLSGDLYVWGDDTYKSGLLGNGSQVSHWIPKRVCTNLEGLQISYISCGPWHTAAVTSSGRLFTFGDGSFGVLGHGDRISTSIPREIETLSGFRVLRVSCGVWHTAAIVEVNCESSSTVQAVKPLYGKLFTWGDGDEGRLGHEDNKTKLSPECIAKLVHESFCRVACGHNLTVALTITGKVYSMGSPAYGQLGDPEADGKTPIVVEANFSQCSIEEISCGAYHVAALTSKHEVYTWGKGSHGQLGHGDKHDRSIPTLVEFLKEKQVKSITCGSNFTVTLCLHKWVSSADYSICSGCYNPFGFRRKRHNCYNCGLAFCKACSSKKSTKASLAPNINKPYRVCDDCFTKLKMASQSRPLAQIPKAKSGGTLAEKGTVGPRLHGQLSRICSADSLKQAGSSKYENDVFPSTSRNFQWGNYFSFKISTSTVGASKKHASASLPGSKMVSQATSPVSWKSTPSPTVIRSSPFNFFPSPECAVDDSNCIKESLCQENIALKAKVEELTRKSLYLEAELERKSNELKEVSATADAEAEKHRAAKEVIKSLTKQLKDMSEPESEYTSILGSSSSHSSRTLERPPKCENDSSVMSPFSRNKGMTEKDEWVMNEEPGVYVTLSALPGGMNELRHVRFSRKRFTEQQAERWWAQNGAKTCELHNVQKIET